MNARDIRIREFRAIAIRLLASALFAPACSRSKAPPAPPRSPELWGELRPVVSVKDLMRDMIDPIADNIFDSVGTVINKKGVVETEPKTDEDWEKIRRREQQCGPRRRGIVAVPNQGQARSGSSALERENRGASKRWSRSDRNREEKRHEGVVGRRRESRSGLRELSPRILVPWRTRADEEARSSIRGAVRTTY